MLDDVPHADTNHHHTALTTRTIVGDGNGEHSITEPVRAFLTHHGLHHVIAFSGGADAEFPGASPEVADLLAKASQARQDEVIAEALCLLQGQRVAILSGGTRWGVPAGALTLAKRYGFKTIGVYPSAGSKHALPTDIVDLAICVGPHIFDSCWGDESPLFCRLLDGAIVYGGGAGTAVEMAHLLKINEARIKRGDRPKFIVPIWGSGGTADALPYMPAKPDVRARCMPQIRVASGRAAALLLQEQLNLLDFVD